jgi:tetratricopeptide (TPR) repeat protein
MPIPFRSINPNRGRWSLTLGVTILVISVIALVSFGFRRPPVRAHVRGHWEAVAQGRMYLRQGRPDKAFEAVSAIRDEAPGAGEAMTVAGLALLQFREYRGARMALERALKLEPNQLDATKTLAQLNLMLGNGPRGVDLLREAARLDPRDAKVWLIMGKVYHELGEPGDAAQAFEEALKRAPNDREALFGLITDLLDSSRPEEASPWLIKALRRFPDEPILLGLAARQARDTGRIDEALALAERALRGDPDNLDALLVRARSYMTSGRSEQALGDLELAVAAHPNDPRALQLLGQTEEQLGLTERSRATIERRRQAMARAELMAKLTQEIAVHPDDPELRWRMGRAAAEGGSFRLASQCYKSALALDPKYQPAREELAALPADFRDEPSDSHRPARKGLTSEQPVRTPRSSH